MSYRALHWAWEQDDLTSTQKFVLVALADMADEDESCYPSQDLLALRCGCRRETVSKTIARLEELGLVGRIRRHRSNGSRTSDRYLLLVDGDRAASHVIEDHSDTPEIAYVSETHVSDTPEPMCAKQGDQNPQRTPNTTSSSSPDDGVTAKAEAEAAFEAFWVVYPRRVGKAGARKAFLKAIQAVGVDVVLDGARRFAADPNLPEKRFVPHPATWLNRGSWEDEPLPAREPVPGAVDASVEEWAEWAS